MYKIYGDYGYTSEILLHTADTRSEALRWADDYVEDGFGGYNTIEVAVHLSNGEYSTIYTYSADDYQDHYEGDDDFALFDEF